MPDGLKVDGVNEGKDYVGGVVAGGAADGAAAGAGVEEGRDGTYSLIESRSDGLKSLPWKGLRPGCPSSGGAEDVRPGIKA